MTSVIYQVRPTRPDNRNTQTVQSQSVRGNDSALPEGEYNQTTEHDSDGQSVASSETITSETALINN